MDTTPRNSPDNLLEDIVRLQNDLRKSDRRVAEVVLKRSEDVVGMTLAALAKEAQVSEPTVIRFCTAIGCDGFRDLRVKLARSLAFARSTSHTEITGEDSLDTIIMKVFDFNLSNLNWAQSKLNHANFERAVDVMSAAGRIEFFGFGASGIVARDAQQKFPLFGVPCGAPTDAHQMYMTADMLNASDVAVGISNTGQTRELVDSMRTAKERGAHTIAITGERNSPLLRECEIALVVETLENTDLYTPTISRLSHLVVVDILSTAVSLRRGAGHHERLAGMKAGLARLRSAPLAE